MILFKEIYDKAVNLFDDPDVRNAYVYNKVEFDKRMYTYFNNAITLFQNPTKIAFLLSQQNKPIGMMDIFDGNGGNTYPISDNNQPKDGADQVFMIDGVIDYGASYDKDTRTVTFSKNVEGGSKCSFEWYYCGDFPTDFASAATSSVSKEVICAKVEDILVRGLIIAWAQNEQNFALDIRNILSDTDFKMYSNANALRAKLEWNRQLKFEFDTMQNKLSWDLLTRKYSGGNYYA